jgi:hypothetical protein
MFESPSPTCAPHPLQMNTPLATCAILETLLDETDLHGNPAISAAGIFTTSVM